MLTNATFLKGLVVQATDGELGTVEAGDAGQTHRA